MSVEQTEKQEFRAFHETIVDTIRDFSSETIPCLSRLIRMTKIPKGHDEIIVAIEESWPPLRFGQEVAEAKASVLKQKQAAAEEAEKKVEIPAGSH